MTQTNEDRERHYTWSVAMDCIMRLYDLGDLNGLEAIRFQTETAIEHLKKSEAPDGE